MNCPKCSAQLSIGERNNVEIDYCPSCRGIWLDAGELDKILDRSRSREQGFQQQTHRAHEHQGRREEKKESWLERVMDIFD